jgi:hypothetical protein
LIGGAIGRVEAFDFLSLGFANRSETRKGIPPPRIRARF